MPNQEEVLFKCYDLVSVEDNKLIARFNKKQEAEIACDWLNRATGQTLSKVVTKKMTVNDLEYYVKLHKAGGIYKSSEDYIEDMLRRLNNIRNCYKKKDLNKTPFVKIDNFWWELSTEHALDSCTVYNYVGGKMSDCDCTNLQIVEADSWEYLDWSGTSLWSDQYKTGWLAPNGKFYGCDYRYHNMSANLVHHKTEKEMEQAGYIKFTHKLGDFEKLEIYIPANISPKYPKPTKAQINYILDTKDENLIKRLSRYIKQDHPEML